METIDLVFHYGGKWEYKPKLSYVGGEEDIVDDFDLDYLSYPHILKKYQVHLGYPNAKKIFALKPGRSLENGLFLLHDDNSIMKMVKHIRMSMGCQEMHIYTEHEVDVPHFNVDGNLLENGYGKDTTSEGINNEAPTQCSNVDSNPHVGSVGVSTGTNFSGWYKSIFLDENDPHLSELFKDDGGEPVGDNEDEVHGCGYK